MHTAQPSSISYHDIEKSLQCLIQLRWLVLITLVVAVQVISLVLYIDLPLLMIWIIGLTYACFNVLTQILIFKKSILSSLTLLWQLIVDCSFLAAILFLTGGATNPFALLFVIQVLIAVQILPCSLATIITGLTVFYYSLLLVMHYPLVISEHTRYFLNIFGLEINLLLLSWWISFLLTTTTVSYFAIKLRLYIRNRDHDLNHAQQTLLQDNHMMRLGAMASQAAHELSTPLATMIVIASEFDQKRLSNTQKESVILLQEQLKRCQDILHDMRITAIQPKTTKAIVFSQFLNQAINLWEKHRQYPEINVIIEKNTVIAKESIIHDKMIEQIIWNILDNAVEAEANKISLTYYLDHHKSCIVLQIQDNGEGMPVELYDKVGKQPLISQKDYHQGTAIYLTQLILQRMGGNLSYQPAVTTNIAGGTIAKLSLPLTSTIL
jgi:two-component system sensor histidine kinase RegB